jgi:cytochrome c oxidase subunit 2
MSQQQPQTSERDPKMRLHWRRAIVVAFVITVLGIVFAVFVPGAIMPSAAANNAHAVRQTIIVFTIVSAPVAAIVWGLGLYTLFAFRWGGKEPPPDEGPPIRGNTAGQVAWITVSVALTLFLLIWGLAELQSVSAAASPGALVVDVTGQQWVWTYDYPAQHISSHELVLPLGRQVIFRVTSEDVIHGFWIAAFALKVDANPSVITTTQTTPTKTGTFAVRCAELCGLYHAYMEGNVQVVTPQAFTAWVAHQVATHSTG